mmetsp:Transcript_137506/g.343068  ORF Transcript_137506/g.343068 Transcript_137506/m.343068 type:complete len:97 (-) Transcript_137506:723-1013(-)
MRSLSMAESKRATRPYVCSDLLLRLRPKLLVHHCSRLRFRGTNRHSAGVAIMITWRCTAQTTSGHDEAKAWVPTAPSNDGQSRAEDKREDDAQPTP